MANISPTLKQGPLLTKLRQRLTHAKNVDIGLGDTNFKADQWYLRPDENGFLVPVNVETATSLDGSQTYTIEKDLDSVNRLHARRSAGLGDTGTTTGIGVGVDESNRYAYVDLDDGIAYQLLYNRGTQSYHYTNSLGSQIAFPAQDVEEMLGRVDSTSNTVHFTSESLQESLANNDPRHINHTSRGSYYDGVKGRNQNLDFLFPSHGFGSPPNTLMPSWLKINEVEDYNTKFQLQLLFAQTLQPTNHPEIISHHPFTLPPRPNPSDGLNASLQALFHLNSVNQVARLAPASSEFQQELSPPSTPSSTSHQHHQNRLPANTIGLQTTPQSKALAFKLNVALRGIAQVGSLTPVPVPKHDGSSTSDVPLSTTQQSPLFTQIPTIPIPPQQSLLITNPLLHNAPIPIIPQIIIDTIGNVQGDLNPDLVRMVPNAQDPKLVTSLLIKHLQSQQDFLFNPTVAQLSTNCDTLYQVRMELLNGIGTRAFRFRSNRDDIELESKIGQNYRSLNGQSGQSPIKMTGPLTTTTDLTGTEINHTIRHDVNGQPYKEMSSFVMGIGANDVGGMLSLKKRLNLECTCGLKGPERTNTTSSLITISPSELNRYGNSLYQYLRVKRARLYTPHLEDLPPNIHHLPCNHHNSIYRSQFQQFLVSRWRADPKSNHFGVVFPRLAHHSGVRREVYNNTTIHTPFLAPIRTRDSAIPGSTNVSLYYLQSFLVYDEGDKDGVGEEGIAETQPIQSDSDQLPSHQRLGDGANEKKPKGFTTYGNISSNGSPSWWYQYRDAEIIKVPIDTVVEASKRLYIGYYTKMPLEDVFLRYYYSLLKPKKVRMAEMAQKKLEMTQAKEDRLKREEDARKIAFTSPRNVHV